jgi:xanthine dehydrogenase iron-sulfur cluster and FAD-binding subunit A
VGGNLANASPAADGPPVLLACGARLRLRSARGTRELPLESVYLGYKQLALEPGELIEAVLLPRRPAGALDRWRKVGARRAQAISKVALALRGVIGRDGVFRCRIGLASVAPVPLRARRTEALIASAPLDTALARQARRCLMEEISPIDDLRSTAEYRRLAAGNLLGAWLGQIAGEPR